IRDSCLLRSRASRRRLSHVRNALCPVVSHADPITLARALIDGREVVVEPRFRIDRALFGPSEAAVGRDRDLDVVLTVSVVLPDRLKVIVLRVVLGDAWEVIRTDESAGDALLGTSPEVAQWLPGDDVVADLRRCRAVQVSGSRGGAARRLAVDVELLPVGVPCGGVPVLKITSRSPFGSATEYEP